MKICLPSVETVTFSTAAESRKVPLLNKFKGVEPVFVMEALRRVLPAAVSLTSNIPDRLWSAIAVELETATRDAKSSCAKSLIVFNGRAHSKIKRATGGGERIKDVQN
jgi:hypothetical protein